MAESLISPALTWKPCPFKVHYGHGFKAAAATESFSLSFFYVKNDLFCRFFFSSVGGEGLAPSALPLDTPLVRNRLVCGHTVTSGCSSFGNKNVIIFLHSSFQGLLLFDALRWLSTTGLNGYIMHPMSCSSVFKCPLLNLWGSENWRIRGLVGGKPKFSNFTTYFNIFF